jgi:thiamine-phosphate pyrophosphorylase
MPPKLQRPQTPLLYLITSGKTTARTTPATEEFSNVLCLIEAAVVAGIDLVQIREKNLNAHTLYQLAASAAGITRGSATKLLINDRSDIAATSGADGVHLTTHSLPADVVRRTFGNDFLIGVSTHSAQEASGARRNSADFIVFGPIFETASKSEYGAAQGLSNLEKVSLEVSPFPVFALGGLTIGKVADCIRAGAQGIAGISMFDDPRQLGSIVNAIRASVARLIKSKDS